MIRISLEAQPTGILNTIKRKLLAMIGLARRPADIWTQVDGYLLELVEENFVGEHDPYGNPWIPSRAALRERRQTLTKTGRLRGSFYTRIEGRALNLISDVSYAAKHQGGTARLPVRAMIPDGRGLPDTWRQVIFDRADSVIIRTWDDA